MSTHGTRSCYVKGCREPECVAANTAYKAAWRARPRVSRPGVFESRVSNPPIEWTREDLKQYANPECSTCGGDGGTYEAPCPDCIMAVWA